MNDQAVPRRQDDLPQDGSSLGKLIHLALPVRLLGHIFFELGALLVLGRVRSKAWIGT